MGVTVREATPQDAAGIGAAHAEAWRGGYADRFPADGLAVAVERRRGMWEGLLAGNIRTSSTLLVARGDDGVDGFVQFGPAADGSEAGEVYALYLHPRAWGHGAAGALMDGDLVRLAETGFTRAVLWTHGEGRAARFYDKSGWAATGRARDEDFGDGLHGRVVEFAQDLGVVRKAANRANWDERTGVHLRSAFYDVEAWLRERRGPRADEIEAIGDVTDLRLLHLQCHFGLDTLAWARVGAEVTGLDFSPTAIDAARDLAVRAGLEDRAEFVCADVNDAVDVLGGATFDVVYVSLGALCWLPSVERWAEQVGALVTPGGRFFIHDGHPLSDALAEDTLVLENDYFEEAAPYVDDSGETYADADAALANRRNYTWNHGIGETVTALIRNGLRLEWLVEHDWTVFNRFSWLVPNEDGRGTTPPGMPRVPLSFSLLATRPPFSL